MQPQVLYVANSVIPRLKNLPHFAQSRAIRAREDPLAYPGTQGRWAVAANEMEEPASGCADGAVNHSAKFGMVAQTHVFQHPHGHKNIKAAAYVAVIILHKFNLARESFLPGPLARNDDLLVREV